MPLQIGNLQAVAQPASASQAAIGAFQVVSNTAAGMSNTTNNFNTIKTLVNQLRTDLVTVGIIKGEA